MSATAAAMMTFMLTVSAAALMILTVVMAVSAATAATAAASATLILRWAYAIWMGVTVGNLLLSGSSYILNSYEEGNSTVVSLIFLITTGISLPDESSASNTSPSSIG